MDYQIFKNAKYRNINFFSADDDSMICFCEQRSIGGLFCYFTTPLICKPKTKSDMQEASQRAEPSQKTVDFYRVITRQVTRELEQGRIPWRRTLKHPYIGFAKNYYSGHKYRGINWLLLNLMTNYEVPYYLTWNQIKRLGGNVLKGTKSSEVFYFNSYYRDKSGAIMSVVQAQKMEAKHEEVHRICYMKKHCVFNIACTKGINWQEPECFREYDAITHCDMILDTMQEKPTIKHQEEFDAYYNPVLDQIILPQFKRFNAPETYYVLLFHSLVHWTGNIKRLARPGIMDSTLAEYSIYTEESLVAELGACMLTAIVGIEQITQIKEDSDDIAAWLQALEEDKRLIFRAASRAQQAVDFILSNSVVQ